MNNYLIAIVPAYILALAALAFWCDRAGYSEQPKVRALVYGLSIIAVCASSSYYSSVGAASRYGWNYLVTYVGAAMAFTLLFPLMRRISHIVKSENIVSISDFLAARYGKSRAVGAITAGFALISGIPFIALQLRSMMLGWDQLAQSQDTDYSALLIVLLLAVFIIFFGVRHPTVTNANRGLIRVVAAGTIFKFVMMAALALLCVIAIVSLSKVADWTKFVGRLGEPIRLDGGFFNSTVLVALGFICAPRQFYLAFVQIENLGDLRSGRRLALLYISVTALLVLPIALAGMAFFGGTNPDLHALSLGTLLGGNAFSVALYLGAFSCAAALILMEVTALSAIASNELVLPVFARMKMSKMSIVNMHRTIVNIRRAAIVALAVCGWTYFHLMERNTSLSTLTIVPVSAAAQFFPVLLGGLYWRRGHSAGAIAGLCGGFAVWTFALAAPQFLENFGFTYDFGIRLSTSNGINQTVLAVLLSLSVNTLLYVIGSLMAQPRLVDRVQASIFIDQHSDHDRNSKRPANLRGTVSDLNSLLIHFIGPVAAATAMEKIGRGNDGELRADDKVDSDMARNAQRVLAGVVGTSLARQILAMHLAQEDWETPEVIRALDEAAHAVEFNRELLQATLDHMSQGVYVTDRQGNLVAWNKRYIQVSKVPTSLIFVGQSIDQLIRYSLNDSGLSRSAIEEYVSLRLEQIRNGIPHDFERMSPDGAGYKILGLPMPGGRYVTTITDVTELRQSAAALQQANEQLEERVRSRTQELTVAVSALAEAKSKAERARNSQARFLAAASHDVLQPLQAARLFIGTARADLPNHNSIGNLLNHADDSIESCDRLMRALLNLSRLEVGGLKPDVVPVSVHHLLSELEREFEHVAAEKGLLLRVIQADLWVHSDPDLLRSVLQNLVGNAIRYTMTGTILVACRRDKAGIRFEIRDSGPGIPEEDFDTIFKEYSRLPQGKKAATGTGLGLSIAERVCKLLGHPLTVRSRVGAGSTFAVIVPRASVAANSNLNMPASEIPKNLRVLCVENEVAILQGLKSLLSKFGADVSVATSLTEALALGRHWDVVIADYHLDSDGSGLDLIQALRQTSRVCILLTANASEKIKQRAAQLGVEVVRKPVSPMILRAILARSVRLVVAE